MTKCEQLKLLVWKNFHIQKKHKLASLFEIGLPCLFVFVLVIIRHYVKADEKCTENPNEKFGGYCDYNVFTPTKLPIIPPCTSSPNCGLTVAYAPKNNHTDIYMNSLTTYFGLNVKGYETEEQMIEGIQGVRLTEATTTATEYSSFLGGVVFNLSESQHVQYKIRLDAVPRLANHSTPHVKDWRTRWIYPFFETIGPREINNTFGGDPGYFREGFIAIQHAIDRCIIMHATHQNNSEVVNPKARFPDTVLLRRFPYPKFDSDRFIHILENIMPFIFLIAFLALNINTVRCVVTEKEKRIKEAMKIMGLSNWVHCVAWYLEIFIIMIIPLIITTLCMKYGRIVIYSDASVLCIFLLSYIVSSISFSFFISSLFYRANVATGASGIFWFLNYTPYFFVQQFYEDLSVSQKIASSILSNTAMGIGCKVIAAHEAAEVGVQWDTFFTDKYSEDVTFGVVMVMLWADTVLYMILAWYVEQVFPGEFGIAQVWYFPFLPKYWGICDDIEFEHLDTNETTPLMYPDSSRSCFQPNEEPVPANWFPIIDIQGLTKQFSGMEEKAVDDLRLKLYRGHIFVLLGHNGAGKTTTISLLTGSLVPTKGTAYVNGQDIKTSTNTIRNVIGYCPQYNVLFDELTVEQHITFFAYLKGTTGAIRSDVDRMITEVGLEDKRFVCAKNLSGGMKRKLCCANALVGNSKIVFLDEPTSGMDPAARRSTWDLLLKLKKDKTIILTTHFMDEADLLGDRIGIMAKGKMCCVGSSMYLKKHFGVGYHLTIVKNEKFDCNNMANFVTTYIAGSKMEGDEAAEVHFLLPENQINNFSRFFSDLEGIQQEMGIVTYGLSITTLEEVFMKVDEPDKRKKLLDNSSRAEKNMAMLLKSSSKNRDIDKRLEDNRTSDKRSRAVKICDHLNTGRALLCQQIRAMLTKHFLCSCRNYKILLVQFLMPLIFTMIPLLLYNQFPPQKGSPPLNLTVLREKNMFEGSQIVYDMTSNSTEYRELLASISIITEHFLGDHINVSDYSSSDNISFYLLDEIRKLRGNFKKKYVFAVSTLPGYNLHEDVTIMWFNNKPYHSIPVALNLYTNAYLHQKQTNVRVSTINHPLPPKANQKVRNFNNELFAFIIAFNMLFGFAFLASSFVIFVVKERISGARHLQMLSGLNPSVYWLSCFTWDLTNFLLPSCALLILFQSFNVPAFKGSNLAIVFVLELLYGWAIIPLMYLLGRFYRNDVVAYTRLIMLNIITGIGAVILVFVISLPQLGLTYVNDYLKWIFIVLPNFCLGQGLGDIYLNYITKSYCTENAFAKIVCYNVGIKWQDNYMSLYSPGIGKYLLSLALLGVIFLALVLALEYTHIRRRVVRKSDIYEQIYINPNENEDVKAERTRVSNTMDDAVRVQNLTKVYQHKDVFGSCLTKAPATETRAVDSITFGVSERETMGLLGVNGAGKTSTFRMLTGDLDITSGTATIRNHDVTSDLHRARKYIGYCPQFDALIGCLTSREHLMMYGRLRGLPEGALEQHVNKMLTEFKLGEKADYYSSTLSGGDKRKLSTAIAVVGYPPVIFLDEPTSGMDVSVRRSLWDMISKIRRWGTAVILTSHSMEECEALCTRLIIMVNGQIKCIGSLQELKSKYGAGYNVQVRVKLDEMGEPDTTSLCGFMRLNFPDAILEEQHQQQLNYIIPKHTHETFSKIFSLFEEAKDGAKIQDYTVSQTTLEQVFLSFARAQKESD